MTAPETPAASPEIRRLPFRRQHPGMIVFQFFTGLRDLFLYFVFISLFQDDDTSILFVVGILCTLVFVSTILSALKWYSYQYRLSPDGVLEVHSGILHKKKRSLSSSSVQAIDIEQGVLHKIFKLVRIRIDTAGGTEGGEVEFTAIQRSEAERINAMLKGIQAISDPEKKEVIDDAESLLYRANFGTLLTYALTSGKVGFIFPFLFAALTELPEELLATVIQSVSEYMQVYATALFGGSGTLPLLVFSILVLLLSWLLSTAMTVFTYASFRITRDGDEIKTTYGLLRTFQTSIPLRQVKSIALRENRLRIPFSLTSVYVEVNRGKGKKVSESTLLIPIVHKDRLQDILETVLPDFPEYQHSVEGPPLRSLHRYLLRHLLFGILILSVIYGVYLRSYPFEELFPLFGAILPGFMFYAYLQWRYSGIACSDKALVLRRGGFNIRTSIVPKNAAQSMVLSSQPLQRLSALCTLTVYLTSGRSARTLRHIDNDLAKRCMNWLPRRTSASKAGRSVKSSPHLMRDPGLAH